MADSIKIELNDNSRAYYGGIAAGAKAADQLAELGDTAPHAAKLQYFWLKVGTELAQAVPDANQERVALFVQGAILRVPEEKQALSLSITSIETPAFGWDESSADRFLDEDVAYEEIGRVLADAGRKIGNGCPEGDLEDSNGTKVGTFKVDIWS